MCITRISYNAKSIVSINENCTEIIQFSPFFFSTFDYATIRHFALIFALYYSFVHCLRLHSFDALNRSEISLIVKSHTIKTKAIYFQKENLKKTDEHPLIAMKCIPPTLHTMFRFTYNQCNIYFNSIEKI